MWIKIKKIRCKIKNKRERVRQSSENQVWRRKEREVQNITDRKGEEDD